MRDPKVDESLLIPIVHQSIKLLLYLMELSGHNKYSPLFVDTEFVPAKLHYLTLYNHSPSPIPTVLPYPSEDITLAELTSTISRVLPFASIIHQEEEELPEHPSELQLQEYNSVKELKEKAGRHWIDGEELFCSSESDIKLEQLVQRREMEKEGGERCDVCCIMLANKSDVIHLSLVWKSQEAARQEILEQVNQLYGVALNSNEMKFHQLSFECSTEEQLTSIRYIHKPASPLQQIIFQAEGLAFVGVSVISNRLSSANFCREKPPPTQRCIEIIINEFQTYRMDFDMIKHYQTKEILGIFSVKAPETKGLKIMGEVYEPGRALVDLEAFYCSGAMLNHLTAQMVEQLQVFLEGIGKSPPLIEHELRKLSEECSRVEKSGIRDIQRSKGRKEVTPLSLFNSAFQVHSCKQTSFKLFYHIIHRYIRNYFTHFNSYFDNSTSGRFVRALYEQLNTLPIFQGEVWRKLDYELACQQGDVVTFNNFIITTKHREIFQLQSKNRIRCKETFIKLFSETGREVGPHTAFDNLEEVIFQPYTKFNVLSRLQDEKTIYLALQEIAEEPKKCRNSVILWVDDKLKEGKETFKQIKKFNGGVLLFQLLSTAQLLQWINSYNSLIARQAVNIIMISNMRRMEAGKENTVAGIESVRFATTLIPNCKVIVYIGSIENTRANLIKHQIDPDSLFITNTSTHLLQKLQAECEYHNHNVVQSLDKLEDHNLMGLVALLKSSEQNMPFELIKDPNATKEAHKAVKSPPMKSGLKNVLGSKVEPYKIPQVHPKAKIELVEKKGKVGYGSQIISKEEEPASSGMWFQNQLSNAFKFMTKGKKTDQII